MLATKKIQNEFQIFIQDKYGKIQNPIVMLPIKIKYVRKGTAGKMTFTMKYDPLIEFEEGCTVYLYYQKRVVFKGFVFQKIVKAKDDGIEVIVYDQMRYLMNKDTICYFNKRASDLLKDIADTYNLKYANIDNTLYYLRNRVEKDKTLLDMIQTSLNETLLVTGRLYTIFDNCGYLTIKNIQNMVVDTIIDNKHCTEIEYATSIDTDVYNQIKLACHIEENPKKQENIYIKKDLFHISQWGILQYFEEIDSNVDAKERADLLLQYYNRKKVELHLTTSIGDINIRGGSMVFVDIETNGQKIKQYILVEEVEHQIDTTHTMKLILRSGEA